MEHTKMTVYRGATKGEFHLDVLGYAIAEIIVDPPEMAEIYADDIAARYNLHDELVAALENMIDEARKGHDWPHPLMVACLTCDSIRAAQDLLDKCKAK